MKVLRRQKPDIFQKAEKKNTTWSSSCFCSRTHTNACLLARCPHETPTLCAQLSTQATHVAPIVLCRPGHPEPDTYCSGKFCHWWTETSGRRTARVWADSSLCQPSQEATAHETWVSKKETPSNKHSSNCGGKWFLPSGCQPLSEANSQRIVFLCLASVCSKLIHDLLLLENQNKEKKYLSPVLLKIMPAGTHPIEWPQTNKQTKNACFKAHNNGKAVSSAHS